MTGQDSLNLIHKESDVVNDDMADDSHNNALRILLPDNMYNLLTELLHTNQCDLWSNPKQQLQEILRDLRLDCWKRFIFKISCILKAAERHSYFQFEVLGFCY